MFSFIQYSEIYFLDDGFLNGFRVLNYCYSVNVRMNSSRRPILVRIETGRYRKYTVIFIIYSGLSRTVRRLLASVVGLLLSLGLILKA